MSFANWCVVILAAGKGKRMKSDIPKVLHEIAGEPLVLKVIKSAKAVSDNIVVVVGHKADLVEEKLKNEPELKFALQKEQKGTGDAVKSAISKLGFGCENVLVLCGDTPLLKGDTLVNFVKKHEETGSLLSVLSMRVDEPSGYGRIILSDDGTVQKIVEEADAKDFEKEIDLVNTGVYAFNRNFLESGLTKIGCNNAQSEYYLTDLIAMASCSDGGSVVHYCLEDNNEAIGINSPEQLKKAEMIFFDNCSVA